MVNLRKIWTGEDMDMERDNQKDKNGSGEIFGVFYIFVQIRVMDH